MNPPAPTKSSFTRRSAPVDGLRALAVLGVIWWHAWIHSNTPAGVVRVAGRALPLERWLVPLGNTGFELFFVISGFCLYLSFQRLLALPAIDAYRQFLGRRWWRLTPAFYVACLVTALVLWLGAGSPPTGRTLFAHATWLLGFIPNSDTLSPVFWTLQVEWEFYLLLPLLFFGRARRLHHGRLWLLVLASLVFRAWIHATSNGDGGDGYYHLPAHFSGFAAGIIVAEARAERWVFRLWRRPMVLLLGGLGLVYLGRGLQSTEVFLRAGSAGWLAKALSDPVVTLGYAFVLAASLAPVGRLGRWLSRPFLQLTGRLSYGLYLWHWWPAVWLCHWTLDRCGPGLAAHYLGLLLTLVVSYPLAWLTYRYCEGPFLRGLRPKTSPALTSAA